MFWKKCPSCGYCEKSSGLSQKDQKIEKKNPLAKYPIKPYAGKT
jgi:hypothetical protein